MTRTPACSQRREAGVDVAHLDGQEVAGAAAATVEPRRHGVVRGRGTDDLEVRLVADGHRVVDDAERLELGIAEAASETEPRAQVARHRVRIGGREDHLAQFRPDAHPGARSVVAWSNSTEQPFEAFGVGAVRGHGVDGHGIGGDGLRPGLHGVETGPGDVAGIGLVALHVGSHARVHRAEHQRGDLRALLCELGAGDGAEEPRGGLGGGVPAHERGRAPPPRPTGR